MNGCPKLNDIGWMCHVVPVRKTNEAVRMPPISQIPNIGCMPDDLSVASERRSIFKSSDSPFVRLSRMGGYPDLLCFKENEPNRGPPVPYRRCDWYYLDDATLERGETTDPAASTKYIFNVPHYMCFPENKLKKKLEKPIVQIPAPPTLVQSKAKKCRKLPPHRPGYAEYNRKLNKVGIAKQINLIKEPIRFPKKKVTECDPTTISRLLANDYTSDYAFYRNQWKEIKNFYEDSWQNQGKKFMKTW